MGSVSTRKFAVLIDADNASADMAGSVLTEITKYGTTFVKRAYGDWTGTLLNGWKKRLLELSIQPMQQFAYTVGKNSTDSAMIIDAMDLLYSNNLDGFCIVSSDSDFTRLASRIRESGLLVFGCGERKTPKPFVTACDKFIYVENLAKVTGQVKPDIAVSQVSNAGTSVSEPGGTGPSTAGSAKNQAVAVPSVKKKQSDSNCVDAAMNNTDVPETQVPMDSVGGGSTAEHKVTDTELTEWLRVAIEACSDGEGWATLGHVSQIMVQWHSDFDPRTYGFGNLKDLLISINCFEVAPRSPEDQKAGMLYARYISD
ncbi:hypothetical protein FSPOR_10800 [Fusarium sporotrichioides]|uniref:HTH OST-type domain-containing protein n=1 Tax=Fusarium sporotrichioides TaxID=5514 RepID=A0A395RKA8_FUSSP|nr:hypothetical protein FSPOR_10800 [Fusarium sporotrichioides]